MIIYKDAISGDEFFSDVFPVELVDDFVYKVTSDMVDDENADDPEVEPKVNNVVQAHQLNKTELTKRNFQTIFKGLLKKWKPLLSEDEDARAWQGKVGNFLKDVLGNFSDFDFYMGSSMDPDGVIALARWEGAAVAPIFYFIKVGIEAEKV
eukprot:TRINITY_DN11217_c0_g1_i1.p1 TRINITY_DN11217_c0_g1~~TRINITY_DN11217_c0_g1_i1.p1  ORF type:complete len:151 (-),score=51.20 TRINITY_DN11217_c0_g1_i1:43-495(-)